MSEMFSGRKERKKERKKERGKQARGFGVYY